MKLTEGSLNGYQLPKNLSGTTNFNTSSYSELDVVNSVLRGKILSVNTGANSDVMSHYNLRISGIGKVDKKLGYYDDAMLIWGNWVKVNIHERPNEVPHQDFIGFVTGMRNSVGVTIHAVLNPVQVVEKETV